MKKIFAIIMSVMMIACFMPTAAFAETTTYGVECSNEECNHVASVTIGSTTRHYTALSLALFAARGKIDSTVYSAEENATATIKLLTDAEEVKWGTSDDKGTGLNGHRDGKDEGFVMMGTAPAEGSKINKIVVDLDGHEIELAEGNFILVQGADLEIKNSSTSKKGKITEELVENKENNYYGCWKAPIIVVGSTDSQKANYSKLTVGNNVTLEGYCGIQVNTFEKGYDGYGVDITVEGTLVGHRDSKKPTDMGAGIEVKGALNQTEGNVPEITLGETSNIVAENGTGIYAGGYAVWKLNGNVNAADAMCVKSGKFEINGGTYTSNGAFDDKLKAVEGSVNTGAALSIITQNGYAGNIDITIGESTTSTTEKSKNKKIAFYSQNGYAIHEGVAGEGLESSAKLVINDGTFTGNSEKGALNLTAMKNKKVIVGKGVFSSNPTEYLADGLELINAGTKWYAGIEADEVKDNEDVEAINNIILAPLKDAGSSAENENQTNLEKFYGISYDGSKVTMTVAPQYHRGKANAGSVDSIAKWIGLGVKLPAKDDEENWSIEYQLSNQTKVTKVESITTGNANLYEKSSGKNYYTIYWDYDNDNVTWLKYRFNDTDQYTVVFIDVNAVPANIEYVVGHEEGKDACEYNVKYQNGVATVKYCGLADGSKAKVKVPIDYEAAEDENTYLYFKYNGAEKWTLMDKGTLELDPKDGCYYEYCWIDLKDKAEVTLQYKYGPIVDKNADGLWVLPTQTGVYNLKVVAEKVAGSADNTDQKHFYTDEVTTVPRTEAEGLMTYTCERCGASYTKTIVKKVDKTKLVVTQPTASVATGSIAKAEGYNETVEYKLSTADAWTELGDAATTLAAGTYYVRVKVTEGKNINGDYYETITINRYSSGGSSGGGYVAPGNTTNTTGTTTATAKPTTTTAGGVITTSATLSEGDASTLVNSAVTNKSTDIVINAATGTAVKEAVAGTKTEITIPSDAVSQIVEKTDASVTVKSDVADVTFDKTAIEQVAAAAGKTGNVKLIVNVVAQNEDKVQLELKLETTNGTVSDFGGGNVSVTVKLSAALAAKDVVCVYIDDNSVYHKVAGTKNADGTFTFTTVHFSSYAVMPASDANKVIADQDAKAKDLTKALKLTARSAKTAKGNIKVTLTVDSDAIKDIEDLGYTVKYKFYRSTKKAASYKAKYEKTAKTYTNTAGTKGTKYYYKARVMVYDADGTLVAETELKQCKYACRIK